MAKLHFALGTLREPAALLLSDNLALEAPIAEDVTARQKLWALRE